MTYLLPSRHAQMVTSVQKQELVADHVPEASGVTHKEVGRELVALANIHQRERWSVRNAQKDISVLVDRRSRCSHSFIHSFSSHFYYFYN